MPPRGLGARAGRRRVARPGGGDRSAAAAVAVVVAVVAGLGVGPALVTLAAAPAGPSSPFEGWFDQSFTVEMVTTGSGSGQPERTLLSVGERHVRLAGAQADVPFVVLYAFGDEVVAMRMLDPVSLTVLAFDFDPRARPVELDLLAIGVLIVPPGEVAHPCSTWPEQARCRRIDDADLYGDPAERWEVVLDDGFGFTESFVLWLDSPQRRVRRLVYPDGSQVDFGRYGLGPLAPELFAVPDEYEPR